MKSTPLRLLLIEDSEFDARLVETLLRKGGYDLDSHRVWTKPQMAKALAEGRWDVIIADYHLPEFSAPAALEVLHESGLDIPFIVVSGGIGEDVAVAAMKAGAHDYVMKSNLARLLPAVTRELREAENRRARRATEHALGESELRYRLLWETATDAVLLIDRNFCIRFANPAVQPVFGYNPAELAGAAVSLLQPSPGDDESFAQIRKVLAAGKHKESWRGIETLARHKDGRIIPIEAVFSDMEMAGTKWFVAFIRDISERKKAESELRENQEQFRVAREIQQHLFPKRAPALPGFDIAGNSLPARATGGDYFDYLQMFDSCVGAVIGDVTGHGVGPALLMAETRAYLRVLARDRGDAGEILTLANRVLAEDLGYERFVTLLLLRIKPRDKAVTYANAGHTPGFILSPSGEVRATLKRSGVPLGIRPDTIYKSSPEIALQPGEILLLVTDGFEEAAAPDDSFLGLDEILNVVRENRTLPASQIVQALYDRAAAFTEGQPQADDLTAMVIKVTG